MTPRFAVQHWYLWSDGKLQYRIYNNDDVGQVAKRLTCCIRDLQTSKVVLAIRSVPGRLTPLRVWTFQPAAHPGSRSASVTEKDVLADLNNELPCPAGTKPGHTQQVLF